MFFILLCVFFSMTSAVKVRLGAQLGAQLGATDLSQQLIAGKNHSNGIGFHVIINLLDPTGAAITFEDCGNDCSDIPTNSLIFHSDDVNTENTTGFFFGPIELSGIDNLYEIKYTSGQEYHHIRAIITPPDCDTTECQIIEESILCDLGTIPTSGGCTACSAKQFQNGIDCTACPADLTSTDNAISCDVRENDAFDALSHNHVDRDIQKLVEQSIRSMKEARSITAAETALQTMITIVKGETGTQRRMFIMGNVMSSILRNLPDEVQTDDIHMDVPLDDANLPIRATIESDFPNYVSKDVRWIGGKPGRAADDDSCDIDVIHYEGVLEVLLDIEAAPVGVLCRGATKIVKVNMTAYDTSTGVETVDTQCWNGYEWDTAIQRQTGDIYHCNNEYLFVGSAGIVNNQSNACANTDVSAPNTLVGCDCGNDQCFGDSLAGNGPYCNLVANDCLWTCIAEYQEMQTSEGHVAVNQLKVGDKIKMSNGKYTTVRQITKEAAPRGILHEVECEGATAHLTENHAYRCNDRWHHPKNRGRRLAVSAKTVDVYSIKTDNHCKDRLLTSTGLEIEPWDGRGPDAVRPYFYDETGFRRNCMTFN